VFSAEDAEAQAKKGPVILVRIETSPEDISGMHAAQGILTARGGMTSHAAVVARGMGKCCVSGASELRVDYKAQQATIGETVIKAGDVITLNGSSGEVMLGEVAMIQPDLSGDFASVMQWADAVRTMHVRTNAETPEDARQARKFGAQGIGLCRTEHMFFDAQRIVSVREMILAQNTKAREAALAKLLPFQKQDFMEIFVAMEGLPVTIRLLDPPLHEFLPHSDAEMQDVAAAMGLSLAEVKARAAELHEANPMLGHRGCRLGLTYPEIYAMQVRAIIEAACEVQASGKKVLPEIMIPLVMLRKELAEMKALTKRVADEVMASKGEKVEYLIGTMIELPRAALRAGDIANEADFFSFGTNDLTQTTMGVSRDDAASFLEPYKRQGVIETDPFVTLDQEGVGELVSLAAQRGRDTSPNLKLGICGEHGGDPASIRFCQKIGLNYVSCSPFRVPIARLAAAQAALAE